MANKPNTINIKAMPIQGHINASKFVNDDWKTIAFSFERKELKKKFIDKELRYNGIYFLFGYEHDNEVVYVGQTLKQECGESFLKRLRDHDDSKTEKYRDKWDRVVAITNEGDTWGPTELYALESYFIDEVANIGSQHSLNGREQNNGGANYTLYVDKITQIKALITAIGFTIFEDIPEKDDIEITSVVDKNSPVVDLHNGMARIPEIITPDKVVKAMVDMLPAEVWNSKTVFLDPACKGGEFLREIYDRLMHLELMQAEFPEERERSVHILKNQIYGIALSQVSFDRTAKKLFGEDRNLRVIPNYIEVLRMVSKKAQQNECINIQSILNKEFGKDMKIDVVIGNPPYQEATYSGLNESGGNPLFDKFIINGTEMTNRLMCFITPTKWISGGQDTFDKVRHALVDEKHLKSMVDYMDAKRIFKDRSIAGGVSYFLFDKEYNGSTEFTTVNDKLYTDNRNLNAEDIIPRHFVGETVISKVKAKATGYLSSYVTKDLWDLPTNFNGNAVKTKDNEVEVITPRGSSYIEYEYACPYRDTYKVMFTRVIPEHAVEPDKNCKYGILSSVKVLEPNQICNASYMVVNSISKKEYAENIKAYLETKFARFLILQTLFGIGLTTDRFKFVPVVDFSKKWTDVDLYSYFELDDSEIEFIEKIIKPITTNSNSNSQQQTTPQPEPQQTTQKPKFTRQDGEAALINQKIQQNN